MTDFRHFGSSCKSRLVNSAIAYSGVVFPTSRKIFCEDRPKDRL